MAAIYSKHKEIVFAAFLLLVVHLLVSFGFTTAPFKDIKDYKKYGQIGWIVSTVVVSIAAVLIGLTLYQKEK